MADMDLTSSSSTTLQGKVSKAFLHVCCMDKEVKESVTCTY